MSSSYWTFFIIYGNSYEDGKKWDDPYYYTNPVIIPEKCLAGAEKRKQVDTTDTLSREDRTKSLRGVRWLEFTGQSTRKQRATCKES